MGICSSKEAAGTKGTPIASPVASPTPPEQATEKVEQAAVGTSTAAVAAAAADGEPVGRAASEEFPRTPTSPHRGSEADDGKVGRLRKGAWTQAVQHPARQSSSKFVRCIHSASTAAPHLQYVPVVPEALPFATSWRVQQHQHHGAHPMGCRSACRAWVHLTDWPVSTLAVSARQLIEDSKYGIQPHSYSCNID